MGRCLYAKTHRVAAKKRALGGAGAFHSFGQALLILILILFLEIRSKIRIRSQKLPPQKVKCTGVGAGRRFKIDRRFGA